MGSPVIAVSRDLSQVGFVGLMLDPPVKIEELRLVAVDDLTGTTEPVFQKFPVGVRLCEQILHVGLGLFRRPVKVAAGERFFDIAVEIFAVSHKPVMFRAVGGGADHQALLFAGFL